MEQMPHDAAVAVCNTWYMNVVAALVTIAMHWGLRGGEGLPESRLPLSAQARESTQHASSTSKWLMRGGSWRFIVQYNRIDERNTIKGRQPCPHSTNLAGLWSTRDLLDETSWPWEGEGFQLH